ncbi:MAG: hypothetical protein ACXAC2_00115 [Candidatus Kariarchaeaceae archaeon]|jgi:hypothetical protein
MSYNQWLGQVGAVSPPNITQEIFVDVLRYNGHVFNLYTRAITVDCTCFNATYGVADRGCQLCGGTGNVVGWTEQPQFSFLGFWQSWAEGRQDQHQRLYEKAGSIDTLDGQIFTESKWFEIIHLDDILVWIPKGSTEGYELRIISKQPRFGTNNDMVFIRLDVTKNPYPMRKDATDYRKQM